MLRNLGIYKMGVLKIVTFHLGLKDPKSCIGKSQVESPSLFTFLGLLYPTP